MAWLTFHLFVTTYSKYCCEKMLKSNIMVMDTYYNGYFK